MTKNAAFLLADLIEQWATPTNVPPEKVRGFKNTNDLNAWRVHTRAADLVRTVDETLQGMTANGEDVSPFMDSLPRWYAAVHFAAIPWGKTEQRTDVTDRPLCPRADISLLRALGLVIDTSGGLDISDADQRSLVDTLREAQSLLEEDEDLDKEIKRYLLGLVGKANLVLANLSTYGAEAVRHVALELGGALTVQAVRAEAAGDRSRAVRIQAAAWNLLIGFVGGSASGIGEVAATEALRQITS